VKQKSSSPIEIADSSDIEMGIKSLSKDDNTKPTVVLPVDKSLFRRKNTQNHITEKGFESENSNTESSLSKSKHIKPKSAFLSTFGNLNKFKKDFKKDSSVHPLQANYDSDASQERAFESDTSLEQDKKIPFEQSKSFVKRQKKRSKEFKSDHKIDKYNDFRSQQSLIIKNWKENFLNKGKSNKSVIVADEEDDDLDDNVDEIRERGYGVQDAAFLHEQQRGKV
jgi:hypothetical protein